MAIEVRLPKFSDEMEEGTVSRWLKALGEAVAQGEPLVEVETEKVIVEVEATADGVLLEIVAREQEVVPVDGVLCLIGEAGEQAAEAAAPPARAAKATPAPARAAATDPGRAASNVVTMVQRQPAAPPAAALAASGNEPPITPLARRVARELGIDLAGVRGTGIGGKIIMSDLQPFLAGEAPAGAAVPSARGQPASPAAAPAHSPPAPAAHIPPTAGESDVALSPLRGTIARRMAESKREIPHFYMTTEVDAEPFLALRARLNAEGENGHITVNDLMLKATAGALRKVPAVNAAFRDNAVRRYEAAHVGFAVATEEGLLTPVVRDCQLKSLGAIARETADLIARARVRKLKPEELQGGTFTISNLGMYDVTAFAAIINPPQVAILGIARPVERPVVKNGWVVAGTRLSATLSADHRALDGVTAAAFLDAFKQQLEHPERLLL